MTNPYPAAPGIHQLGSRYFTCKCSETGLCCAVLSTDGTRTIRQPAHDLPNMDAGWKNHHLYRFRKLLLAERFDQLCDAGAGTVHLPVTSYQGATHALPRRSKWAQMVLKEIQPGKRESRTNFSNHCGQFFGIATHLI